MTAHSALVAPRCELSSRSAGATSCDCRPSVTSDNNNAPSARIGKIESRLKNPHRERIIAHRLGPKTIFGLQVEQMPARAAEREEFRSFSEHFDFTRRAQDRADMAVLERGALACGWNALAQGTWRI